MLAALSCCCSAVGNETNVNWVSVARNRFWFQIFVKILMNFKIPYKWGIAWAESISLRHFSFCYYIANIFHAWHTHTYVCRYKVQEQVSVFYRESLYKREGQWTIPSTLLRVYSKSTSVKVMLKVDNFQP